MDNDVKFNATDIKLIVGLGNPGNEYKFTRHNAGFMFLDTLAPVFNLDKKLRAEIAEIHVDGSKVILAKPNTYMNHSGEAVRLITQFYKIAPQNMIIAHDDLDIKLGSYKLQFRKAPKAHNGITSIEQIIHSKNFWRLRIGVENRTEDEYIPGMEYVLNKFTREEQNTLSSCNLSAKETIIKNT